MSLRTTSFALATVLLLVLSAGPMTASTDSGAGADGVTRHDLTASSLPRDESFRGQYSGDFWPGYEHIRTLVNIELDSGDASAKLGTVGAVVTVPLTRFAGHRWDYAYADVTVEEGSVRLEVRDPNEGVYPGGTTLASGTVQAPADSAFLDLRDLDHEAHEQLELTIVLDHSGGMVQSPILDRWVLAYCQVDLWHDPFLSPERTEAVGHLNLGNGVVRMERTHIPGGLNGDYYDTRTFGDFALTRLDQTIDFNWGNGAPDSGMGANTFSVRWVGKLYIEDGDFYTFYLRIDDGGRLWIDGSIVIDEWRDQSPTEFSGQVLLAPGLHDIRLEFYENTGTAVCQLRWSSSRIGKQVVPHTALWGQNATNVLVSEVIELPEGHEWEYVRFMTDSMYKDIRYDVLDAASGNPIFGYTDRVEGVLDMSRISSVTFPKLRLRARWADKAIEYAPQLTWWAVKWLPERTWRAEFLTDIKVHGTVSMGREEGYAIVNGTRDETSMFAFAEWYDGQTTDIESTIVKGEWRTRVPTSNVTDVAIADLDGDGFDDVVFTSGDVGANATAFRGTAAGFPTAPTWTFVVDPSQARKTHFGHVLAEDMDGDGGTDLVLVEVNSILPDDDHVVVYFNNGNGWNDTPDLVMSDFDGAIASIDVGDIDGDGRQDLAVGLASGEGGMVVVYNKEGGTEVQAFYSSEVRVDAVHVGDIDGDGYDDVANAMYQVQTQNPVHLRYGSPEGLDPAHDEAFTGRVPRSIEFADWYGDGVRDVVMISRNRLSIVPHGPVGTFAVMQDYTMMSAEDVAVIRASGDGDEDLAVACSGLEPYTSSRYAEAIGTTGIFQRIIETDTAIAVASSTLFTEDMATLRTVQISPRDITGTGSWGNISFRAAGTPSALGQSIDLRLLDAETDDLLWNITSTEASGSYDLSSEVAFREHTIVVIEAVVRNPHQTEPYMLDHLEIDWTPRVPRPPEVLSLVSDDPVVYRTNSTTLRVSVRDEYDIPGDLELTVEMRPPGGASWNPSRLSAPEWDGRNWTVTFITIIDDPLGNYSFRARVEDSDLMVSAALEALDLVVVINNPPTAPTVTIGPEGPKTRDELVCSIQRPASDRDDSDLEYSYNWSVDGDARPDVRGPKVPADLTAKGQTWRVEVRALDGHDESPPTEATVTVLNSPPELARPFQTLRFLEDDPPAMVHLKEHFVDPDGDPLVFTLSSTAQVRASFDAERAVVELSLPADWYGEDAIRFNASDGEGWVTAQLRMEVEPIPDPPEVLTFGGVTGEDGVFHLEATQGTASLWEVVVTDVDSDSFRFRTSVDRPNFEFIAGNGTVIYTPNNAEVGLYVFNFSVEDDTGNSVVVQIHVSVSDVNDPPGTVVIILPKNGMTYEHGATILLQGNCSDPDAIHGQQLEFTWFSDLDGVLGHDRSVSVSDLSEGKHRITLEVSDGYVTRDRSVSITVLAEPTGPNGGGDGGGGEGDPFTVVSEGGGMLLVLLVLLCVVVVATLVLNRHRVRAKLDRGGVEVTPEDIEEMEELRIVEGIPVAMLGERVEETEPRARTGTDMRSVMLGSAGASGGDADALPSSPWSEEELRTAGRPKAPPPEAVRPPVASAPSWEEAPAPAAPDDDGWRPPPPPPGQARQEAARRPPPPVEEDSEWVEY